MNSLWVLVLSLPFGFPWLSHCFSMVVILGFCHYQVALHKSTAKRKKESNVKAFIFNWASIEDSLSVKRLAQRWFHITSSLLRKLFLYKNDPELQTLHSFLKQISWIPFCLWLFVSWWVYETILPFFILTGLMNPLPFWLYRPLTDPFNRNTCTPAFMWQQCNA